MKNILEVKGLTKRFAARDVLRELELELREGQVAVLLGTNGAGKSTLLRCILGLLTPDAGMIRVLGRDPLREARAVRQSVGYVPDQADAYGWMSARDLFRFLRPQYPTWSDERAESLLERLKVPMRTRFEAMSRGEAAKAMLAAALAPAPSLIVLDEPFARLAPPVREEVLQVFVEEAPFTGGAALVATHELDVASRIADRVLVLDEGRCAHDVALEELGCAGGSLQDRLRELYPNQREELVL